jgi:Dolichyl-phosphate-mannose-protein mannosyltransferase
VGRGASRALPKPRPHGDTVEWSLGMRSRSHPALVFAAIWVAIFLLHLPLLQLPYFWDEAGYYVPAARDLLLTGSLIPHTTVSNAHPPLVLAWMALWWKCVGFAPLVTRSSMLVIAAFSLLGLYRLAEQVASTEVAIAATVSTALYPVFFAQSSLAQVDLAAAGMTFWALAAYLQNRTVAAAAWFSLAVLAKETAAVGLAALVAWELIGVVVRRGRFAELWQNSEPAAVKLGRLWPLTVPFLVLFLWYAFHYRRTGYVFGNPEFFRYNVASTLNPLRILLALAVRLWQAFGYLHLWVLTVGMLLAMLLPPVLDEGVERGRMEMRGRTIFLVIVTAYVVAMGLIGGAELARYMLPAVPLVIVIAVSTLARRLRYWPVAIAVVVVAFVGAWFWNPPYGFSPEDNLAYRDYLVLHQEAERFLEARYPMAHVLTAWPASDELTRPWLGFITRPMQVVRVEDFSLEQVLLSAEFREHFETALVFSTKYEPPQPWLDRWSAWNRLKARFFDFHRDLPPRAAAQILGGRIVFAEQSKGQWTAVIEMEHGEILNASSQ